MERCIVTIVVLSFCGFLSAQDVSHPLAPCDPQGGNEVRPLHHDSLSSSFLICVPHEVKPHYHRLHTEHVVVLDGKAEMLLGDSLFQIGPGDVIAIPRGTVHAVTTRSERPLRVASIQSPRFDGSDRVPAER